MARRASSDQGSSVSLFPFLSILACIIGALTLLIAALSMTQLQGGRDPEEVAIAEKFVQLQKKLEEEKMLKQETRKALAHYLPKLDELAKPKDEAANLEKQLADALKLKTEPVDLDALKTDREKNKETVVAMDKQLGLARQQIEGAKQELLARRTPDKGPTVMVKPSRRGHNRNYAFVDLGARELIVFKKDKDLTIPMGQVAKGEAFKKVTDEARNKGQTLVVLVRQEGAKYYGMVESLLRGRDVKYGKLPITGDGEIDLSFFSL